MKAPREKVWRALIDPRAIAQWRVPEGMTMRVHEFEAREAGRFRISLVYDDRNRKGKTTRHADTYHGRFVKLVPNEEVVEVDKLETEDPAFRGEMKVTFRLVDADGETDVVGLHEGLPRGVSAADNELGWRMALTKLVRLVEEST